MNEVRTPNAPTAYVEVDFHDVPTIAKWIISNTTAIGEKIAQSICNYLGVAYKAPASTAKPAEKSIIYKVKCGAFSDINNAKALEYKLK